MAKRIAWAVTGAGHVLEQCVGMILNYGKVDVFLSRAAEEVLGMYRLDGCLAVSGVHIYRDIQSSSAVVSRLFEGAYHVLVIAPATSNSVAKFVHGISDTLVTNLFAQAGKSHVPVIVFPTDLAPEMDSLGPNREPLRVYPRPVDLENTGRLRSFPGVTVVDNRDELERRISFFI